MKKLAVLAIMAACSTAPKTTVHPSALLINPCDISAAVPDDGVDDTAVIQAALTAHCAVKLQNGIYNFAIKPKPRALASLTTTTGASLTGVGPGTILKFAGDVSNSDYYGINMIGDNTLVSSVQIDTTGVTNASEQTHGIQVSGPATNVQISDVTFNHATTPTGGDCLKAVGYGTVTPSKAINGLKISRDTFLACNRSGVGIHSGVYGLELTDSHFLGVKKMDIDTEEVGGDSDRWVIANDTFLGTAGSEIAIGLEHVPHVSISNVTIIGRSLYIFSSTQVSITGTVVRKTVPGGSAALQLEKANSDITITGSVFTRDAAAGLGPVVNLLNDNGGYSTHVVLDGDRFDNQTAGTVIVGSSPQDLTIANSDITGNGGSFGIDIGGIIAQATRIVVSANRFSGVTSAAVRISGSHLGVGRFSVIGNTAEGIPNGLRCENVTPNLAQSVTGITGPILSGMNSWGSPTAGCTFQTGF